MINYYLLTKPGIVLGNLFTVAAGFLLASKSHIDFLLFFQTLAGLALVMASACVFNNYIDRHIDDKMERTKNRALVKGIISGPYALGYAVCLGLAGLSVLIFCTNVLTAWIAFIGFFVYVIPYSLWKSRTVYGTAIGSVAGAVPPVVGYCAAANQFDAGAMILFSMMVLWQMPHFFSIALLHTDDYRRAGIPVLPIEKGVFRTKVHMLVYIAAFTCTAALLTAFDYTGYTYLALTVGTSLVWLWLSAKGFARSDDRLWGQEMFRMSLVIIACICITIAFDRFQETAPPIAHAFGSTR